MLQKIIASILISLFLFSQIYAENFGDFPDFSLSKKDNSKFTEDDLKGSYTLVNFFFTKCPHICPAVNGRIFTLAQKFKDKKNLDFLSITVDPKNDTPEKLQEYSKRFNADQLKWDFLTGEKETINKLIKELKLAIPVIPDNHTTRLFFLNPDNQIIAYYSGLDNEDFNRLKIALEAK